VTGPGGNIVDGAPKVVDNQLRQALQPGSEAGAYTVLWRVTSADGHPISGRFTFTATAGSAAPAPAASGEATAPTSEATSEAPSSEVSTVAPNPVDDSAAGSTGTDPTLIWLLVAFGALAVAAGIFVFKRQSSALRESDSQA
jgi:copper resistance protein C